MISKKIDINKLKIKYLLKCYTDLPEYPTSLDILYELILSYSTKSSKKIIFTNQLLNNKWNLLDDKINQIVSDMLNNNMIKVISEDEPIKYEVINNPFSN